MPYNEEAGQTNDGAAGGVFWKGGQGQPVLQSTITADIATIIQNRVASEEAAADAAASAASIPNNVLVAGDIGVRVEPYDSTILKDADIGVTVQAFDATLLKSADIGVTVQPFDATLLKSADIGVKVQAFDATLLKSADIGVTVQPFDADTAKLDQTANFTAGLQDTGESLVRKKNGDTGAARLPVGTTLQQPTGEAGLIRFNSTDNSFEGHNGTEWGSIGGGAVSALNGGQLAGMRNKIINGKMDIAQRGTNFVSPTSGTYTLDRWAWTGVTAGAVTVSQQADVPASNEFQNSIRVAVTTADTIVEAGDEAKLRQVVEGFNVRDLIGRSFTLSFRVRSSKVGTHCVALKNVGPDRTYVAEYTVNAANTWETKSITVPGGLITEGTWNWTNGAGLYVDFALFCGTTYQTTAGAWQIGNFVATANQVNCLDTIDNIFAITGVQLEVGTVATPFEHRPIGQELALCERYFQKVRWLWSGYANGASIDYYSAVNFRTVMRAPPTITKVPVTFVNCTDPNSPSADDRSLVAFVRSSAAGTTLADWVGLVSVEL